MQSESDRRDQQVLYEPNERPPNTITFALGFQAAMLCIAGIVITPVIVVRAAGGGDPLFVVGSFCRAFGQRVDHSDASGARWTHWRGLYPPHGHFWRVYRGLRDGSCRRWRSDARNAGHYFVVVPICALHAAFAVAADHYADRGWNGDHADCGDRYADCL